MTRPQFAPRIPRATPAEIRASREAAGHSQERAARLVYVSVRTWKRWEAGDAPMPPAALVLYRLRTGQLALEELDRASG